MSVAWATEEDGDAERLLGSVRRPGDTQRGWAQVVQGLKVADVSGAILEKPSHSERRTATPSDTAASEGVATAGTPQLQDEWQAWLESQDAEEDPRLTPQTGCNWWQERGSWVAPVAAKVARGPVLGAKAPPPPAPPLLPRAASAAARDDGPGDKGSLLARQLAQQFPGARIVVGAPDQELERAALQMRQPLEQQLDSLDAQMRRFKALLEEDRAQHF